MPRVRWGCLLEDQKRAQSQMGVPGLMPSPCHQDPQSNRTPCLKQSNTQHYGWQLTVKVRSHVPPCSGNTFLLSCPSTIEQASLV
ncbi:hypothetical protein KOW79_008321 [Hemibagrus wyckioides]|uniref:Uncharacterized protein n=1 Tax=Hemibagrus wyckioides TaxID=337641 RepID=A0A9D3NU26_9TELE|nr:hypothetical protein KOW79_008321 [Hemibagrus wyckioides]